MTDMYPPGFGLGMAIWHSMTDLIRLHEGRCSVPPSPLTAAPVSFCPQAQD